MADAGAVNFGTFPKLKVVDSDVSGSWRKFKEEFLLAMEFKVLELGVRVFGDRAQVLALLTAIGQEGRDTLKSVGFDMARGNLEDAWELLCNHYDREENIFVRTQKFVSVTQLTGENDRDYLLRVERLSRDVEFGPAQATRKRFALVIAVNGLRDSSVRKELMSKSNLDWDTLSRILRTRETAREAAATLSGNDNRVVVKQEIGLVDNRSNHRDNSRDRIDNTQEGWRGSYDRNRHSDRDNNYGRYNRSPVRSRGSSPYRNRDSSPSWRENASRNRDNSPSWRENASRGSYSPRSRGSDMYSQSNSFRSSPKRENGYSPRHNSNYSPRGRGGYSPRSRSNFSPRKNIGYPPNTEGDTKSCHICGSVGHFMKECPEIECHNCHGKGHISRYCSSKDRCDLCQGIGHESHSCPSRKGFFDNLKSEKSVRISGVTSSE